MNTNTIKKLAREISSIECSGIPETIWVSINMEGQAIWGEAMALPEIEMIGAVGVEALEDMMTADDFRSYYADVIE